MGHNHARTISNTFKLKYSHYEYVQYCENWGIPSLDFYNYLCVKADIVKFS